MAGRLTREEQQKVIQLKEAGHTMAEIKEKTGRSKEAITRILTFTGLYPEGVDTEIWREARIMHDKHARATNPDYKSWKDELYRQPIDVQQEWFNKARPIVLKECKAYRDQIMADVESPVNLNDAEDGMTCTLDKTTKDQLDYISAACGGIDRQNLVKFIICKEYLELKKKEK